MDVIDNTWLDANVQVGNRQGLRSLQSHSVPMSSNLQAATSCNEAPHPGSAVRL